MTPFLKKFYVKNSLNFILKLHKRPIVIGKKEDVIVVEMNEMRIIKDLIFYLLGILALTFSYSIPLEASEKITTDPIFKAAKAGNVVELKRLLKENGNPNKKDKHGETPLMHAAQSRNLDAVKLLINNGANVNSSSNHRFTALMYASMNKNGLDIVKFCSLTPRLTTMLVLMRALQY